MLDIVTKVKSKLRFDFPYDVEDWVNNKHMLMENYHKHTNWSNFTTPDSATNIEDFIEYSKCNGSQCYFSGEHGFQGEWLKVYDICKHSDIHFRYSAEVYWVKDNNPELKDGTNCHMVVIARNYNGVRKLNYMISRAYEIGYYKKPRIDLKLLFELNPEDVYVTSACVAGWGYEDAPEIWYQIAQHFGDSFFLEYQCNNTERQKEVNTIIQNLSRECGIQTIVGLDTHYLNDEDRIKRDNILARKHINYPEEEGWYMDFPDGLEVYRRLKEQNVLSDEEIIYSMMNTQVFINGCEEFEYNTDFKIPVLPELRDKSYEERCEVLKQQLYEAYSNEKNQSKEREDGIEYELNEIIGSGTADYFLSNRKLVNLAINKYGGVLTTTSRGSASSYYCSKLCGFTTVDRFESEVPIYPERFITKDRILSSHQAPDIDCNVASQQPFVNAARELFGDYGCYPLLAVGKLGEKSGFKLYADVKGIEPSVANDITTMIDQYNEDVKNAEEEDRDSFDIGDYIKNVQHRKIFEDSKSYQGIIEIAKCHACGHILLGKYNNDEVIGDGDVRYEFGLIRCVSESNGNSVLVVNAEGSLLDLYGYVKDDFLIVDVVGIIDKLYKSVRDSVPPVTELRQMVAGDKATWDLYANGITCCLNQCEKSGTTHKVKQYKPQTIGELAAFIAGIRPGFKSLIDNFLNRLPYSTGEPAIDELLEDSFHYMLYQESIMKIYSYLGIPMKDSYDTIKKISKKKLKGEALQHVEDILRSHWLEKIGNIDNCEKIFTVIKQSSRYSFNSAHALSMAYDSLYEAWFKAHHTSKFYEVTINHYQEKGDKDKVAALEMEATTKMGYTKARYKFGDDNTHTVVNDETKVIHPNLVSVKYMNAEIADQLYTLSQQRSFESFIDVLYAISELKITNSRQLEILIKMNYFSDFGNVLELLNVYRAFDKFYGKVNLKKSNLDVLSSDVVAKYCLKNTAAMYKVDESGMKQILTEYERSLDIPMDKNYILVKDLDTKYSPVFTAVCIETGQEIVMKVGNRKWKDVVTSFKEIPFEDGDILKMIKPKRKPRSIKTDTGWVDDYNNMVWWLLEYQKCY